MGDSENSELSASCSGFLDSCAPEDYLDPITMVVMEDPVTILETGRTYELSSIQEWFERGNWTCPLTNVRLKELVVVSNPILKRKIDNWKNRASAGEVASIDGWSSGHEDGLENKRMYHFGGAAHTGLPTEAELIRHREEVEAAAQHMMDVVGARQTVQSLRLLWDPEQGWVSPPGASSTCYIAGPNLNFGNSACTSLSRLLQPRPNPDGCPVFNEAIASAELLCLKIGVPGATALARALGPKLSRNGNAWVYNRTLTTLRLSRNYLDNEGTKEIAELFTPRRCEGDWLYCTVIEHLDLSFNNIGDMGIHALAEALAPRQNADGHWVYPPLKKLNLYGNPQIGDRAISALVRALLGAKQHIDGSWAFNENLTYLCIDGTNLGQHAVEESLGALEVKLSPGAKTAMNKSLQVLDLSGSVNESSFGKLLSSSVAKVIDMKSSWHVLQGARRTLQNQRFQHRRFRASWLNVRL
mmetsp:Transcript_3213/g.9141  ORF Transcript_3213/g.9141 Transcript_3213/m.9141 type:complete len:470 (-) Transcript_3213:381-1790(-)|eukprot:CAMPEP_0117668106 /NCGR_PEP_ID=MMETSP0804-20121206/11346_1 /TAXON_ID=1074897 /ORGANISM="Tetraselmis astigmatica, Strain CCMP880" /LENGTH=469 /DNA_ID=CAMNT_0005475923 /DNA_START=154 /DNA_END=1563 /DNA_ORIENTATION=-